MVQVAALIDPRLLVEVEVVAHREGGPNVDAGDADAGPARMSSASTTSPAAEAP